MILQKNGCLAKLLLKGCAFEASSIDELKVILKRFSKQLHKRLRFPVLKLRT